jgi:superfamily II DNA or RNA helicase
MGHLINLRFPAVPAFPEHRLRVGAISQIAHAETEISCDVYPFDKSGCRGWIAQTSEKDIILLTPQRKGDFPKDFKKILHVDKSEKTINGAERLTWIQHPVCAPSETSIDFNAEVERVLDSWKNQFSWIEEDPEVGLGGLRTPQIAALHAIHAHFPISDEVATVVMPTGTGKTEVMLATLVSLRCRRLLVIVSTDILRTQMVGKFRTLGLLTKVGVASPQCLFPVVGKLDKIPSTADDVDDFFAKCNVIVTTMQVAGQCEELIQKRMAHHCPCLFIDEAHHVSAPTWDRFRKKFATNRVFQFTATPYRNDGRHIGGKIVFNYRLRKAQEAGYFKQIRFTPIIEFSKTKSDEAIAVHAVAQLREDVAKGLAHILMARVETVSRAKEVFKIYEALAPEFAPVQLHSDVPPKERSENRHKVITGESRIVVCVDMLGEGFDLPELKIAAFHDVKKSLPVTLQLAGRFVRSQSSAPIGEPTFIANIGDADVNDELRTLYSHDSDWNALLPQKSEAVIQKQIDLMSLIDGFKGSIKNLALQHLRPAMSTVIYKTRCRDWAPENFPKGIDAIESYESVNYDVNRERNILVAVLGRKVPVDWARADEVFTWEWDLLVAIWDRDRNLLFINSASNSGYYNKLAEAVAGDGVELINGREVFRCLSGINRLLLQNVGLIDQIGRLVRYTMRAGRDVEAYLTAAQKWNSSKGNIFGVGYEGGEKTSIGCSYKGRIWSRKVCNLDTLHKWCVNVGEKLLDDRIDPDKVLNGTLEPVPISSRPAMVPIAIEWPERIYDPRTAYRFLVEDGTDLSLDDVELRLKNLTENGPLEFEIFSEFTSIGFILDIFDNNGSSDYSLKKTDKREAVIRFGSQSKAVCDFFNDDPPIIWFADGSSIRGAVQYCPKHAIEPYDRERIEPWDWSSLGVDITKESQGVERFPDSIQYAVIRRLLEDGAFGVVFDDDGPGEIADVVAVRAEDDKIVIQLYHCKFSREKEAGARIEDMYEVCGQAQKNIFWLDEHRVLFRHLMARGAKRDAEGQTSRYQKGDMNELLLIQNMTYMKPIVTRVYVVQPGLSKKGASEKQLALLSVTENYLMETYKLPFAVIASA